ncbi:hypothetical protein CSB93_6620 (plasmid) [Pseudomonas paraeruginosa]|uniref:Uncharacterized protein n=1 Tax=Pseudomonas paraeruginosa TaxID=2994495 RepID=A0A2R3J5I3_9PSED|nr:hypothetical protein CSB93_6620 [Pseudomonas paraeruginosa]AWE95721.1 hypothetical protein CSC28_6819 [Pseudomonas paraeruginosa]
MAKLLSSLTEAVVYAIAVVGTGGEALSKGPSSGKTPGSDL